VSIIQNPSFSGVKLSNFKLAIYSNDVSFEECYSNQLDVTLATGKIDSCSGTMATGGVLQQSSIDFSLKPKYSFSSGGYIRLTLPTTWQDDLIGTPLLIPAY
jgi:hypothetical protein